MTHGSLTNLALLSIAAALLTLALKFGAYVVTDSVGLLSDAVESTVNLVAALTALFAIWYAGRPIDRNHPYGHEKIEFFASGIEGMLILIAAGGIGWYAIERLRDPRPVEEFGLGVVITILATGVNLIVARMLLHVAKARDSVVLAADGKHLMADVLTSGGVIIGLLVVRLTGIEELDPIIALLVAVNIIRTGLGLMQVSVDGLLDRALPERDQRQIRSAIARELEPGATFHALRTRKAGNRRFVDFHLLLPGELTVQRAHEVTHRVERAVESTLPGTEATIHIEPIEEPASWDDSALVPLEGTAPYVMRDDRRLLVG
ncbi:MAG: cation transporter [Thermomicrobiales bacterium]|nr:cation transporter [Thermomicrobiales bacterium]